MGLNCGIYQITNLINGHRYIGSSVNIEKRIGGHRLELNKGNHCNPILQRAWNKYGEALFKFSIILFCDRNNTLIYEQKILDNLLPEYNIAKCTTATALGRTFIFTEEHKRKLSEAHKGKKLTEEHKRKVGIASRNCSDELREFRRQRMIGNSYSLGKKLSEEHKKKVSLSLMGNQINLGRKHTDEWKENMRKFRTGYKLSDVTKEKIRQALKGNTNRLGKHLEVSNGV